MLKSADLYNALGGSFHAHLAYIIGRTRLYDRAVSLPSADVRLAVGSLRGCVRGACQLVISTCELGRETACHAGQTEHSAALADGLEVATASLLSSPGRLLIPESILGHRPTSFLPADAELLCRMVVAADGRSCVCTTRSHWCAHRPRCSSRLDDTLTTHTLRRSTVFSRAGTAAVPRCVST